MITKKESNFIKLVAMISMLIDHIGAFLFPYDILRIIGRVAFPIFAYQLAVGYKTTSDKSAYLKRLLIFAVISQVPYSLLRGDITLNIIFSLVVGFLALWAIERKDFFFFFIFIVPLSFFVSYSFYGIAIIVGFYFLETKFLKTLSFSLATLLYSFYYVNGIQLFSILSILFIYGPKKDIDLPKYLFYIFYPAHLMVIYLIKICL